MDVLNRVIDKVDPLQIMSVSPDFGGQSCLKSALRMIAKVHRLSEASGRDIRLGVDGGIKVDNVCFGAEAGTDAFVAGSAIFGQKGYSAAMEAMRAE